MKQTIDQENNFELSLMSLHNDKEKKKALLTRRKYNHLNTELRRVSESYKNIF